MKAGVASPTGVVIQDVPDPKPKSTDILVRIKAIALNRADLGSAKGDTSHGAAAGKPIGSEFSGEVVEVGSDVRDFKKGDRVMCHSPGSHAEVAASDYGACPAPVSRCLPEKCPLGPAASVHTPCSVPTVATIRPPASGTS